MGLLATSRTLMSIKRIYRHGIINVLIEERADAELRAILDLNQFHDSWDKLIKDIFNVANDRSKSSDNRKERDIYEILT